MQVKPKLARHLAQAALQKLTAVPPRCCVCPLLPGRSQSSDKKPMGDSLSMQRLHSLPLLLFLDRSVQHGSGLAWPWRSMHACVDRGFAASCTSQ